MQAAEKRKPAEGKSASSLELSIAADYREHTPEPGILTRQKRWRLANPDAYRAHLAVSSAIARGVLERPDACEECGATDRRLDAHHPDYRDRLRVKWWCRSCHLRHHFRLRKAAT